MDVKSFLIGFLLAACLGLALGSTPMRFGSTPGMYQAAAAEDTVVILNTQTGEARVVGKDTARIIKFSQQIERGKKHGTV